MDMYIIYLERTGRRIRMRMGEWRIVVTSFLFIVQGNHLVVELSTTGSNGEALFPCFNIRFQEASNPFDLLIVTNYELLGNEFSV
jgi:hypothetical protein